MVFDGGSFEERIKMIQELNPEQGSPLGGSSYIPLKEVMADMSWKWVIDLLLRMLGPITSILSPAIKAALTELLLKLYADAVKTPNPWDDWFVGFLLDILSIPRPVIS
jgi:hypothetical protein